MCGALRQQPCWQVRTRSSRNVALRCTESEEAKMRDARTIECPVQERSLGIRARQIRLVIALLALSFLASRTALAQNRYATSDNHSGYVHWIDLYDASNSKIDPTDENPKPYSPEKTCGRCHEYDTISHGWHFNAVNPEAKHGRPGQPWIWSDERTGTHLPLSYRGWEGTHNPDDLGISRWEVAAKLGGFMPGGGVGSAESFEAEGAPESEGDRSKVTGALPVDCMLCHRNQGSGYSPFVWTEQIEDENFPYAPTAALGIATVSGSMTRLKEDFDATAEGAADKLPKVTYEASRFRNDGKVFFDLIRKPTSNACYYCHTNIDAESVTGSRWLHDEDVHLRAGLKCADCHRNSLDHHTVRGFDGEEHPAGKRAAALSCNGCHMPSHDKTEDALSMPGRLGAPKPEHKGLPPIHFEKMTCTACHSGPMPSESLGRQVNSIAHHLGKHVKRTGEEGPGILAAVNLPVSHSTGEEHADEKLYTPHRMMWPSFWGTIKDGELTVLNPEKVYDTVRRKLKVRREFIEELSEVKLPISKRKELLGDERYRVKEDERTEEEKEKIAKAEEEERKVQVAERIAGSLAALEEEFPETQAVFVTGGEGFVLKGEEEIESINAEILGDAAKPYSWPVAHNVRPARQSLGINGCTECHSDDSLFFQTRLTPIAMLPGQTPDSIAAIDLQNPDRVKLDTWNQLFAGRSQFKIAGLIALGLTCLVALSAMVWNLSSWFRR